MADLLEKRILATLFEARARGNLAQVLTEMVEVYRRVENVPLAEALRRLGEAAGIHPGTVRQIMQGGIRRPPNVRLNGFARVLCDVVDWEGSVVLQPVEPPSFDQIWTDLEEIVGTGIDVPALGTGVAYRFRYVGAGIDVEEYQRADEPMETGPEATIAATMGTERMTRSTTPVTAASERLPREEIERTWQRLAVGPVKAENLIGLEREYSQPIFALLSLLPYVDFSVSPQLTLFRVAHTFTNSELRTTFGGSPQGGIRYSGTAENPRSIVFITSIAGSVSPDNPYHDRWEGGVLYYTGEGRKGDQTMTRGNLALNVSASVGCPVYGFAKRGPDQYVYLGRYRMTGVSEEEQQDSHGDRRKVFVFQLEPEGDSSLAKRGLAGKIPDRDETSLGHISSDRGRSMPQETFGNGPVDVPAVVQFDMEPLSSDWNWPDQMGRLVAYIKATGFIFEPWQIAAYITALRTKPFVILAGISGTGKSRLPQLVAEAVGYGCQLIPVRPDWTDSSDLLGYTDLAGHFRPGTLLHLAEQAANDPSRGYVVVLDEMNLARVEHYFAEVLSRIEDQTIEGDRWRCKPLMTTPITVPEDLGAESQRLSWLARWARVPLPPNLAVVGTVNMDESTHGFSRKVLDRAFTLELSDVELSRWGRLTRPSGDTLSETVTSLGWPASAMIPNRTTLATAEGFSQRERGSVQQVIQVLERLNQHLRLAQLQVGYRVRDEVALFVLNAAEVKDYFVTEAGEPVDPLDLAVSMKVLPRIIGGSGAVRRVLLGILGWANGRDRLNDEQSDQLLEEWMAAGRPQRMAGAPYPLCAARACMMWERLVEDGFTSYWL